LRPTFGAIRQPPLGLLLGVLNYEMSFQAWRCGVSQADGGGAAEKRKSNLL
jgi:hypothetical protein